MSLSQEFYPATTRSASSHRDATRTARPLARGVIDAWRQALRRMHQRRCDRIAQRYITRRWCDSTERELGDRLSRPRY
jgi:hypothetical protein